MSNLAMFENIATTVSKLSIPDEPVVEGANQAAVAIILRPKPDAVLDAEMLFIKRAEREGDPWSGHMAFPGGRVHPADPNLEHTSVRETAEEIGLDLSVHGRSIGAIDPVRQQRSGTGIMVMPYVFLLPYSCHFQPNYPNHEVEDVVWGSVNDMVTGKLHTTHHGLNGFDLDGYTVWGMTYRMTSTLLTLLYPDWTATGASL